MSKTKRSILLVALSLILVAMCGFSLYNYKSNNVTAIGNLTFEGSVEIADEYTYGTETSIPGSAKIEVGGQSYDSTTAVVVNPDGSVQKAGLIVLDQVGYYTARYYYEDATGVKYEQIKFLVAQEKYSVTSENISAEYIADLSDTAKTGTYAYEEYSDANTKLEGGKVINDGIRLTLAAGDTFNYNTPIKLNQNGLTDIVTVSSHFGTKSSEPIKGSDGQPLYDIYELERSSEKYLVGGLKKDGDGNILWDDLVWKEGVTKPYMYEDIVPGTYEIYYRITDAYNVDNYVEVSVTGTNYTGESSASWNYDKQLGKFLYSQDIRASFGGNAFGALRSDRDNDSWQEVYYNGTRYDVFQHTADAFSYLRENGNRVQNRDNQKVGYDGNALEYGVPNADAWCYKGESIISQKRMYLTFQYDATNHNIYYRENRMDGRGSLLMNLDLIEVFGEAFPGFSSDEVYLSVYAKDVSTASVYADIVDIGGTNLDPDNKVFQTEIYNDDGELVEVLRAQDTTAPVVDVTYTPTIDGKVIAARNCEFPIFEAVARDVNLDKIVTEVYYGYEDENNKGTLVYSDGETFIPKQAGNYTIVYYAYDRFGNMAMKTVDVICIDSQSGKLINLDIEQADIDAIDAKAGITINLPKSSNAISGLNGNLEYNVKAIYLANGEEVIVENDNFTPLYAGAWQIVYEIKDSITSVEYVFDLTVASSDAVAYQGAPGIPKYLIGGAKYSFEDFNFYSFAAAEGRTDADYTISISYDGADFITFNDEDTIDVTKSSARIKYASGDNEYVSGSIEIVDVGYGENINNNNPFVEGTYGWDIAKYFKTTNVEIMRTIPAAIFKATQTVGSAKFDYIKELSASNFKIELKAMADDEATADNEATGNNFSKFNITLTDYYDPTINVKITLETTLSETKLYVDGNMASQTAETIFDTQRSTTLRYSATNKAFYLGSDTRVNYKLPFTSDKVYVSFEMSGITGEAGIAITTLVNQRLGNLRGDTTNTLITVDFAQGNKKKGEKFIVSAPEVIDVLSPVLRNDVKVSVVSPSGSAVYSTDGVNLSEEQLADRDYEITLDEYGDYIITYLYKDQLSTRKPSYANMITVVETEPPQITFKDGSKVGVTIDVPVGRPVTLKGAVVTDNVDTNPRLTVFVGDRHMNLKIVSLNSEGTRVFTPLEKGLYRITYRAADATGNSNIIYYYLNVK